MARKRIGDGSQCTARSKGTTKQCKLPAMPGVKVCRIHGGLSPSVRDRVQHAVLREGFDKLLLPVPLDHPEANPLEAFSYEWRRTIAAIEYWSDEVRKLALAQDLVWGKTKQVDAESTEFPGVDTTYESKINIAEASRREERKHLVELLKLYVKANIAVKHKQMTDDVISKINDVIVTALMTVNADPNDPKVREAVTAAIANIGAGRVASPAPRRSALN